MHTLDQAESLRAAAEQALPAELLAKFREAGLALAVSASVSTIHTVVIDDRLEDKLIEEEIISEMPAFRKRTTGVDNTIFISAKVPRHVPRIKVAIDPPTHLDRRGDNASVAIADGSTLEGDVPSWLKKQVTRFLDLNREVLIDYWEQQIDDDELRERLRSIAG